MHTMQLVKFLFTDFPEYDRIEERMEKCIFMKNAFVLGAEMAGNPR